MAGSMEARTVGYGFKPTEEQLFGHFLKKKLKGELEANCPIPDLNIYDWEPSQLFFIYDFFSTESSDGRECFFFCPRGRNRKTQLGYWKETSRKCAIRVRGTGKPVGNKMTLVYHEGRRPKGRRTDVAMHEYHLNSDASNSEIPDLVLDFSSFASPSKIDFVSLDMFLFQLLEVSGFTAWVVCHIIKRESKKAKSATASASTDLSSHPSSAQVTKCYFWLIQSNI
ncbi:hypothetical protein BT93_G1023 [Corymbia citriodora subsp. variegata]|nr:hypothetical protein BT93_G1023 [Corymbia citriodora subsp. variegata]